MADYVTSEEPADSEDVLCCVERYCTELGERFGYVVDEALPLGLDELTRRLGLVFRDDVGPVGCGALKLLDPGIS
jgi:hypothetical protein